MATTSPPIRPSSRGFSLIELLVAIGIVSLLVAIAIPVFSLAYDTAKSSQASAALNALESAEVEYESATGQRVWHLSGRPSGYHSGQMQPFFEDIDWGSASVPRNYQSATGTGDPGSANAANPQGFIERFIALIDQRDTTRTLWRGVDDDFIRDTDADGFAEIVDPWDTPIVYAAFVSHKDDPSTDDFLPQHGDLTGVGGGAFIPKSPAPFFASAGPDGDFGDASAADGTAAKEAAEDNIYSFDLGKGAN
jgi:prepilin-type N-terminal cleavage/methylation domain-containing protein